MALFIIWALGATVSFTLLWMHFSDRSGRPPIAGPKDGDMPLVALGGTFWPVTLVVVTTLWCRDRWLARRAEKVVMERPVLSDEARQRLRDGTAPRLELHRDDELPRAGGEQ